MRRRPALTPLVAGVIAFALLATGCTPKTKPVLVKVDSAVYQSIQAIHDTAVVLGNAKIITPQQELKIQEAILPVAQLGEQASIVLRDWKAGPTPPELQKLVQGMGLLVEQIVTILPGDSPGKAAVLEKITLAMQAIAAVLVVIGGAR